MSLYVTRHGETDWNKDMLIQGRLDVPLNEKGIEQAQELRQKLKNIHLDIVFCSPLGRAKQTADIALEGRDIPIVYEEALLEQYYGTMEGEPRVGEKYLSHRHAFATRYPEGEGYMDVAARIYPFLRRLEKEYKEKDVLLVCHGGISRVIHSYFFDLSNDEFIHFGLGNCEVRRYEFR